MSGLQSAQFILYVIKPSLADMGDKYNTRAARILLLATGLHESGLRFLHQLGGGPALGLYQMEPRTHDDIWNNFLVDGRNFDLRTRIGPQWTADKMIWDLKYATQMARIQYWRVKEALPLEDDIQGMASYWKRYYNTRAGDGRERDFVGHWKKAVDKLAGPW